MPEQPPNLDSLLLTALKIESPEERAAFLTRSCGADESLRKEVDRLLAYHQAAGSLLESPAAELAVTLVPSASAQDLAASLQAGLAPAFRAGEAVVIGRAGHSVLKTLGQTLDIPPVMLRESAAAGAEPVVRPSSPEIPKSDSASRYRLDGEIARGGMGAILKGRDTDLGRDLAIKVLLDQHMDRPEIIQRFVEEAQIGGQLQHPGIAPIYELGQFADKRPFFSMKLVRGETLSKLLADRTEPTSERGKFMGIFEQICQTMAYAHSRGVIHRDLKPANIMVGAFGEVQVMDWGLAKVLQIGGVADEKKSQQKQHGQSVIQTLRSGVGSDIPAFSSVGSQTQLGSVMGTPAYMPPEQALGEIDQLDERADVFGLGAILAEILTGQPPYVADDGTQVFRMASRGKLTECFRRLDACGHDEDLVAIAKHCLSPDPIDRPRDAGVLAARITAHLASVETRLRIAEVERAAEAARATEALRTVAETKARARAEQRTRRLQLSVAVVGLVAVSLGGAAAFSSAVYQRQLKDEALAAQRKADELRIDAENASLREQKLAAEARDAQRREAEMRSLAEEREQVTQATLYASEMNLAAQAAEVPSGLRRVGEITSAWKPDRVVRDLRGWEWYYLESLRHAARESLPSHHAIGLRWSPDGKRYATFGRDHRVRVWDKDSGEMLFESVGHTGYVYEVAWNPAGTQLASAGRDFVVRFWDAKDGQPLGAPIEFGEHVYAVRWSPDGTRLAIKTEREAVVCSAESRQIIHHWPTPINEHTVSWHPKLDQLAVPHAVYDAKSGEKLWSHTGLHVEWSPDGTRLATSVIGRNCVLLESDGRVQLALPSLDHDILSMMWSPTGDEIAFGLRDSTIRVWNARAGRFAAMLRGHDGPVGDVAWNHDGTLLASTSPESIKLWDWPPRANPAVLNAERPQLFNLAWSDDGRSIFGGSDFVESWDRDTLTRQSLVTIGGGGQSVGWSPSVSWSQSARSIAARREGKLVLLDDQTGELRRELPHDVEFMRSLALNADGTRLATSSYRPQSGEQPEHGEICLYDTATGGLVWKVLLHGDRAGGLAWSPDGRKLACSGWTSVEILDAADGRSLGFNAGTYEMAWVHDMCWSPDGEQLALGHLNHIIRVIDVGSGRDLLKLVGHTGPVKALSWSPDGQRIASGGDDKTVRIWNARSGLQVLVLNKHSSTVETVAWSPDGKQLASGSITGELLIWDTRMGSTFDNFASSPAELGGGLNPVQTQQDAERELARLTVQLESAPMDAELLNARGMLLARLGRWSESAESYAQLTKLNPDRRYGWAVTATPLLMAGDVDRYRQHCRAMVEHFKGVSSAEIADTVCKTALLLPDVVPLAELPVPALRDGITDPKWQAFRQWFLACGALISYREGQPAEAIRWTTQMADFRSQPGALALVVRAMSEHKLEQSAAARESLKAAELQIPLQLRTLGTEGDATSLPVALGVADHDWIVPEILRREAEQLMRMKK